MIRKNAVLCTVLSILFILICAVPAFAVNEQPITFTVAYTDNTLTLDPTPVDDYSTEIDWSAVFADVDTAINNHAASVDLSKYNIPVNYDWATGKLLDSPNRDYLAQYVYNEPKLLRVVDKLTTGFSGNQSSGMKIQGLNFEIYELTNAEYHARVAACEDVIAQFLYGIKGNNALSDVEKCLLLHDRLATWAEYNYIDYLAENVPSVCHTAYGALVNRYAVCQGYAHAYAWMMNELGIANYYVDSSTLAHGWNLVTVNNGKDYFVDITSDDPVWDIIGRVNHNYFLVSHNYYATKKGASDFSTAPTDTTYESNQFWLNSNTEIQYINGTYYYINSTTNKLMAYTPGQTPVERELVSLPVNVWRPSATGYYAGNYSKLTSIGNKLYYSTTDTVQCYDLSTNTDTVYYNFNGSEYGDYYYIYGLTQINGKLIVQYNNAANTDENSLNNRITVDCCNHTGTAYTILDNITPATCKATGSAKAICADCRAIFTVTLEQNDHTGTWTTVKVATCNAQGSEQRVCTVCKTIQTRDTNIDPNNHTNTELRNTVTATCTTAGYTGDTYCKDCNKTIATGSSTQKDAANHTGGTTIKNEVTATCKQAGYTGDTYCIGCGSKISSGTSTGKDSTRHVGGTAVKNTAVASCMRNGYSGDTYCLGCNAILANGKSSGKDASNHEGGTVLQNEVIACCIAGGYSGDTYCKGCSVKLKDGEETEIDADNHINTIVQNAVDASCIEKGFSGSIYCQDCKKDIETGHVTEKDYSNHVGGRIVKNKKIANCNSTGYSGDTYCLACTLKISDGAQTPINPDFHVGGNAIYNTVTATCCISGYTGDTFCTGCNKKIATGLSLGKDPENHSGGTVIRKAVIANCTTAGYTGDTHCGGCNQKLKSGEVTEKDLNNHASVKLKNVVVATCIATGYSGDTYCVDCNKLITNGTTTAVDKNNHVGKSEVKDSVAPTCTSMGYSGNTYCTACNTIIESGQQLGKTAHVDADRNGTCDICGTSVESTSRFIQTLISFFREFIDFIKSLFGGK